MADIADRADDESERSLADALRVRRPGGPVANGRCHWCDEVVSDVRRWCSVDCREQWEKHHVRG